MLRRARTGLSVTACYGALAGSRGRQCRVRRAARVVAMRTRRAWFCGLANPRAVRATIFAVRLCASALAFDRVVDYT